MVDDTTGTATARSDPWLEMMDEAPIVSYWSSNNNDDEHDTNNDEMIQLPIDERKECFPLSKYATKGVVRLNLTKLIYSNEDYINDFHRMKDISDQYSHINNKTQQYKLFNKIGKQRNTY